MSLVENKIENPEKFMTLKARAISYINVEIENYEEQGIINKINLEGDTLDSI